MQTLLRAIERLLSGFVVLIVPAHAARADDASREIASAGLTGNVMGADFLIQFTVGLLLVLLSVVALAWFMRRFGRLQSSANGSLEVIGGLALGARERIVLIQVGDTQVLLGVAPGRVQAVHVLDEPVTARSRQESRQGAFAARLREALKAEKQT